MMRMRHCCRLLLTPPPAPSPPGPRPRCSHPYIRKCAFDVGDYGMGFVANSLELGW